MLEEICIRRRAGQKFEPGSILKGRWLILSSLSHSGGRRSDGCFNRGIKLVQDISSRTLGVLKMLSPDICCPGHAAREIGVLRELRRHVGRGSANVVQLLDSYSGAQHPHDVPWMVTALCDGGTLAQLVDRYARKRLHLPEAFLWHVFESLADALRFYRSHGVVHRDVTLTNVLLQRSTRKHTYPRVLLGDFGCAVTADDLHQLSLGSFFPGNPRFMPPEGCEAQTPCDVYQIGLVMLCLLKCDLDPTECIADFYDGQYPVGLRVSNELVRLIAWCLLREPEQRPNVEMLPMKLQMDNNTRGVCERQTNLEGLIEMLKLSKFSSPAEERGAWDIQKDLPTV